MSDAPAPKLEFPLEWNGKVIACDTQELPGRIRLVLERFELASPVCRGNCSAGGRYVTYTLNTVLADRKMMDELFSELAAIPGVKLVL